MSAATSLRAPLACTRRSQTGVAIIELTMVATLLLVLLLGVIEIGRGLNEYKMLVNQVEGAARYLASRPPGTGHAEAECLVRYGVTECSGTNRPPALLPGLGVEQSAKVEILDSVDNKGSSLLRARTSETATDELGVRVNLVRVTVTSYRFEIISGKSGGEVVGEDSGRPRIPFPDISSTQRQFAG